MNSTGEQKNWLQAENNLQDESNKKRIKRLVYVFADVTERHKRRPLFMNDTHRIWNCSHAYPPAQVAWEATTS